MKRILQHVRLYIEIYIAMGVSIAATVIGLLPGDSLNKLNFAIAAMSGALVLISVIALRERGRSETIITNLDRLDDRTSLLAIRSDFLEQRNTLIDRSNSELLIMVRYGDTLLYEIERVKKALHRGVNIRLLVCSPDDEKLMELLALRADRSMTRHADPKKAKALIEEVIASFNDIANLDRPRNSGKLEIRKMRFLPPFVLLISDPKSITGEALIAIANFRKVYTHAPSIKLDKCADAELYEFFHQEFMKYWDTDWG